MLSDLFRCYFVSIDIIMKFLVIKKNMALLIEVRTEKNFNICTFLYEIGQSYKLLYELSLYFSESDYSLDIVFW